MTGPLVDSVEAVAAQPTPHCLVEALPLSCPPLACRQDLATFRQGLNHRAPVSPGLVLLEPSQGKLPAVDYSFDRLVIANQLIGGQQTGIIFQHLGFSLMSRWQARIGDLNLRADPPGSARFASSGRQILIGRIFLRRWLPALSKVAQICPHLTAQPGHTAGGLQSDALGNWPSASSRSIVAIE